MLDGISRRPIFAPRRELLNSPGARSTRLINRSYLRRTGVRGDRQPSRLRMLPKHPVSTSLRRFTVRHRSKTQGGPARRRSLRSSTTRRPCFEKLLITEASSGPAALRIPVVRAVATEHAKSTLRGLQPGHDHPKGLQVQVAAKASTERRTSGRSCHGCLDGSSWSPTSAARPRPRACQP